MKGVLMQGEYDYYATRSNLLPRSSFSLADHRRAYLINVTGGDPKLSLADLEQLHHPSGERAYWVTQAAGDSLSSIKVAAFVGPTTATVRVFRARVTVL
jgi:hypothetical protein